jgi:hypothetical protein
VATTDAINAVCNAIIHILQSAMAAQRVALGFDQINPQFAVYSSRDFTDPPGQVEVTTGATVFLYRVLPNIHHRTPAGRILPDGQRQRPKLPLDLHLIVTIWGANPVSQNRLVGWVTRTLEDYPTIPPAILNLNATRPIFNPDEAVELTISEMSGDELLQIWDQLGDGNVTYHISIPYLVRAVGIESQRVLNELEAVQIRSMDIRRFDEDES